MPASNFKIKHGLDVAGNINPTGLVDNVDLWAFKTNYDSHNHSGVYIPVDSSVVVHSDVYDAGSGYIITATERTKLGTIDESADVTGTANVSAAGATMKSLFGANSILSANSSSTPLSLTVTEQTIVGRITGGDIAALSPTQIRTLINVENNADVTDYDNVNAAGAVMNTDFDAGTFLYATSDNLPEAKNASQVRSILNVADGATAYTHGNHTGEVTSTGEGLTVVVNNVIDADNLKGDAGALGDGTNGYALVAGGVAGRFAWHGFGAAADKGIATGVDTSSDLPTSSQVKTYVDNQIAGLGRLLPGVADLAALKAEVDHEDKDMILVEDLGLFRFDDGATDTSDDDMIVTPTAGDVTGRWYKMSSSINEHANLGGIDKWGDVAGNTYHVPDINSNTNHFLRGDGSWATPAYFTHDNHTGHVHSVADGATTIQSNVVANSMLTDMAQNFIKGRISAGSGDPEDLSATDIRTILNVADGANAYTHPTDAGSGFSIDTVTSQVIDLLTVNAKGHVTNVTTRILTLGNLGYTGSATANDYDHPNHTGHVHSVFDGETTIQNNVVIASMLTGPAASALANGANGNVLQSDGTGRFKWGTAADPSQVAYAQGESSSFIKTSIGTTEVVCHTFSKATFRSMKYILSINDITNGRYETSEIIVTHDGTNAYYNESGMVDTGVTPGVSFVVAVNGGNVELKATGTSANNTVKGIYLALDV